MSKDIPDWVKSFKWVFTIPIILLIIMFSISNKHVVEIFLWPLPKLIELPVYILSLSILMTGVIFGYLAGCFKTKLTNWKNQKEYSK